MTNPLFEPKWTYYGNCDSRCPGGSPCYCRVWPGCKHSLCVCSDPDCPCHARERYEPAPEPDWKDIAVIGNLHLRQYLGKTGLQPLKPKDLTYQEWQDLKRARGLEKIPDEVAPGWFGDDLDLETYDTLLDLMDDDESDPLQRQINHLLRKDASNG